MLHFLLYTVIFPRMVKLLLYYSQYSYIGDYYLLIMLSLNSSTGQFNVLADPIKGQCIQILYINVYKMIADTAIELLWNWEYFGFPQLFLGYKPTFTLPNIVIINSKYIKHVVNSIMNCSAPWSYNSKVCLYLRISWEKPTFAGVPENNIMGSVPHKFS